MFLLVVQVQTFTVLEHNTTLLTHDSTRYSMNLLVVLELHIPGGGVVTLVTLEGLLTCVRSHEMSADCAGCRRKNIGHRNTDVHLKKEQFIKIFIRIYLNQIFIRILPLPSSPPSSPEKRTIYNDIY